MAKLKTTCYLCKETIKGETAPSECPKCGANLSDPQQEIILKETHCQYSASQNLPGGLGNLYLTNLRLLWVNSSTAASYGGGLVGGLVGALIVSHQKWGFSLPLSDIQSFEDSKFGLFVKAFTITAKDGSTMKLSAKPREEWVEAIKKAQSQAQTARL